MYLMLATRPDISYDVTKLAQFISTPTTKHRIGATRILCYLCAYDSVCLCLGNSTLPICVSPSSTLIGYFDASLMDCPSTRKSTVVTFSSSMDPAYRGPRVNKASWFFLLSKLNSLLARKLQKNSSRLLIF